MLFYLIRMKNRNAFILIYWTAPNIEEAREIASSLVRKQLIACASLIPQVESIYEWEGKLQQEKEILVMMKTRASHFESARDFIESNASYEVPEILHVPIQGGNVAYLNWVEEITKWI